MAIILDIETLADLRVPEEERGQGWQFGQCKHPKGEMDDTAKAWANTGLKPHLGLLWMIGVRHSEDEARKVHVFTAEDPLVSSKDAMEQLDEYLGWCANKWNASSLTPVVAHNAVFDCSWISKWALKYSMRNLYELIPHKKFAKPYEMFCTSEQFAGVDFRSRFSLRDTAKFLDLPEQKMEIGSVLDLYLNGKTEEAMDYCAQDVLTCEAIWKRLEWR